MKYLLLFFPVLLTGCFNIYTVDNFSEKTIESSIEKCKNNLGVSKINFAIGVYDSKTNKLKHTDIGVTCNNGAYFNYTIKEDL